LDAGDSSDFAESFERCDFSVDFRISARFVILRSARFCFAAAFCFDVQCRAVPGLD
jgi:hypothetical protein